MVELVDTLVLGTSGASHDSSSLSESTNFDREGSLFLAAVALVFASSPSVLAVDGAHEPISICSHWVDEQEVVHLKSRDQRSLFACLGYYHGKQRAWQMEFFRKALRGESAEWVGQKGIRGDVLMRLLDLPGRAEGLARNLQSDHLRVLEAYSRGATRGMAEAWREGIPEFESGYLNHDAEPRAWTPADSIAVFLMQSLSQTQRGFLVDLEESEWAKKFGDAAPALFSGEGLPWSASILLPEEVNAADHARSQPGPLERGHSALPEGVAALSRDFRSPVESAGSNNWVLGPSRSNTDHAWIANDPHLDLRTPPFWFWVHVTADVGGIDAIGASLPGFPVIASGLNRQVAWGVTNSYMDTADLVEVPRSRLERTQVLHPTIWVRWWKFRVPIFWKTFERTEQGLPILPLGTGRDSAIVLRWSGLHVGAQDIDPIFDILGVRSAHEMDEALSRVGVPSWNYVFADVKGNIGYRTIGKVPRREMPPVFGVEVSEPGQSIDFETFLSADELPHLFNPKRGWVATANHEQWPKGRGPRGLRDGRVHSLSFRGFRIAELLAQREQHDFTSLKEIQCDVQAVDARFLVPKILAKKELLVREAGADDRVRMFLELLGRWDFEADGACRLCAVYRRWIDRVMNEAGIDERALYRRLSEEARVEVVSWRDLATKLSEVLTELGVQKLDSEASLPLWRDILRISFDHLSGILSFSPTSLGGFGDKHSVNPGVADWDEGGTLPRFRHRSGASHRLIVELSDPPAVYAQLAGSNLRVGPGAVDAAAASPWSAWGSCAYQRRRFPLDWTDPKVLSEVETITF